jgi:hypothetical protein
LDISSDNKNRVGLKPVEDKYHGTGRPSGSKNKEALPAALYPLSSNGFHESDGIGIESLERSIFNGNGIDGTDNIGSLGKDIQVSDGFSL